jgi:hypothetical protein
VVLSNLSILVRLIQHLKPLGILVILLPLLLLEHLLLHLQLLVHPEHLLVLIILEIL